MRAFAYQEKDKLCKGARIMTPTEIYDARIKERRLEDDEDQRAVLLTLDALCHDLASYWEGKAGFWSRLRGASHPAPKGLYLYGDVGRGKSMLMDLFFEAVENPRKRRVHFHRFMREVHEALHEVRSTGVSDAIPPVASKVAEDIDLLCFDEMQIRDIADAMIVGRFFEALLNQGVVIVTTSNRHPDALYEDGLNRHLFLPFIAHLKAHLDLINFDGPRDYRSDLMGARSTYFSPFGADNRTRFDQLWDQLRGEEVKRLRVENNGREVILPEYSNGVGRADFAALCEVPLGASDYLMLAQHLRVLFLSDLKRLTREMAGPANRLIALIDACYEGRVRLVIYADVPIEQIFKSGTGAFEFARSASRIKEMTSKRFC